MLAKASVSSAQHTPVCHKRKWRPVPQWVTSLARYHKLWLSTRVCVGGGFGGAASKISPVEQALFDEVNAFIVDPENELKQVQTLGYHSNGFQNK